MFEDNPVRTSSDRDAWSSCWVKFISFAAAMMFLSSLACAADGELVVKTPSGKVRGRELAGLMIFKGVPYAAAPVGALRWKPPRPSPRWHGVRDAGSFGAVCPQPKVAPGLGGLDAPQSEDCLTLNIWSPRTARKAPVMVWIHGGGFTVGSGAAPYYDGSAFARDGVILVTLNYRLGILGFFADPALTAEAPPDAPLGNYGIMDQIAALRWVHENIGAFGGDPSNVTVAGESAGGSSVLWLLACPTAKALFGKAIVESAAAWAPRLTLEQWEARGRQLAAAVGLADSVRADTLRRVPVETLVNAKAEGRYRPAVDGRLFAETPEQAFADGTAAGMPLLIGSNSFEASIMKAVGVDQSSLLAQTPATVREVYGESGMDDARLAESIYTDGRFGAPARWFAAKMSGMAPAYVYQVSYVISQLRNLAKGANHGAEITFVFETGSWLERLHGVNLSDEDRRMAHLIHSCWVGFVRHGDPHCDGAEWPRFVTDRAQMLEFGAKTVVRTNFKSAVYDALENAYLPRLLNH